jgi:hypothetical protein
MNCVDKMQSWFRPGGTGCNHHALKGEQHIKHADRTDTLDIPITSVFYLTLSKEYNVFYTDNNSVTGQYSLHR